MLKIQVAQINPTVCDLQGNVRLMIDAAVAACTAQAQLGSSPTSHTHSTQNRCTRFHSFRDLGPRLRSRV